MVTVGAVGPEPDVRWYLPVLAEKVRAAGQYGPGGSEAGGETLGRIRAVGDRLLTLIDEGIALGPESSARFADGVETVGVESGTAPATGTRGRVFVRPLFDSDPDQLVLEGTTLLHRRRREVVVWVDLADPATAETWPEGRWCVTAPDGVSITVIPGDWERGATLCRLIAQLVPRASVVTHDHPAGPRRTVPLAGRLGGWLREATVLWLLSGVVVYGIIAQMGSTGSSISPGLVATMLAVVLVPLLVKLGRQELAKRRRP